MPPPPPLVVPAHWRAPPDEALGEWSDEETPRSPGESTQLPGTSLPSSPDTRRTKSKLRTRQHPRTNSLRDAKVLLVSDMHRSESAMDPSLFQYHQHFESPWQLVGKTHLSEVYRVRHRNSGEVFAIKRSRRRFRSKLQRERCLREIRAVAALPPHPNIVTQYRAWQEAGHFHIQMSFCEGGSLAQRLRKACEQGQRMTDEQLFATACEAAQGLHFLHSHNVMHLDIKPENLYMSGGTWRIGDFGLAVARDKDGSMDWEEGDGDYVAPELLQAGGEPSPASDIFSLGATLYECATGHKLPRSDGWAASDVERLAVSQRPDVFVQMLQQMLQPSPALRPTAHQVLNMIAREQPALAARAAAKVAAVAAEVAASAEAAAAAAVAAQHLPGIRVRAPQSAHLLAPSPFMAQSPGSSFAAAAAAAALQQPPPARDSNLGAFSFDIPAQDGRSNLGLTPCQALRAHHRQRCSVAAGPPGTVAKAAPTGRARLGARWAPALSPLISEGALTPGTAAAWTGITPGSRSSGDAAATPLLGRGSRSHAASTTVTPLDVWRPAPLQLPAQTSPQGMAMGSSSGGRLSAHLSSSGTQDSKDGWHLRRCDIISPGSEALNASQSDSDYSYSCGTGKTMSDLDFADALSPMSRELVQPMSSVAMGPSPASGTPGSLQWQQGDTPGSNLRDVAAAPDSVGPPGAQSRHRMQVASSLAWDLHTSPEFLMVLPPGSPESLSRSSSLDDAASLPSRATSVRRFPTLDSWGSQLHLEGGAACSKSLSRGDSLAALAAQRFTNTFVEPAPAAPSSGDGPEANAAAPLAAVPVAGRGLRKRQHSSRRTLIAALSRDNSVASSMDGMQPLGKLRHIAADSGPSSPCGDTGELPAGLPRALHRSGSMLGREAWAAATGAGLAEASAAAASALATAAVPRDVQAAGAACGTLLPPFRFDNAAGSDALVSPLPARQPPQSPQLHARMTCMKLRDAD